MNALNIKGIPGKQLRLRRAIERALEVWPVYEELPNVLIMSEDQYEYLKRCRNFGNVKEWRTVPAEHRIYATQYNAMEVRIR